MHQLERLLDHFRSVADNVEQPQRVGQFGADRGQARGLAGAAGNLIEHCPISQRPVAFTALKASREQPAFQLLATDGRATTGSKFPFHFGRQAHKTDTAILSLLATATDRQQIAVVLHQPGAVDRRKTLSLKT
ncbi:hypothetical protein D3C78_537190 [compost metagenome]